MPEVRFLQHRGVRVLSLEAGAAKVLGLLRPPRARVHAPAKACNPHLEVGVGFTIGGRTRRSATVLGADRSGRRPWH